jgi:hypothetical protein
MARTTIVSAANVTNVLADQQVAVRVSAGGLGFIIDLANASSGTLQLNWQFSHLDAPDVTDDTHWYTPVNETFAAQNALTGISDGRYVIDITNRFSGASANQFTPAGVPTGVNWMRVSVQMSSVDSNTTTVIALHNPGPASSTASVTAS